MWNCDSGNILFRKISLKLVGSPEWSVQPWDFIIPLTTEKLKMAQIALNLEKTSKENREFFHLITFLSSFIGIPIKFLIYLSAISHTELGAPVNTSGLVFSPRLHPRMLLWILT